MRNDNKGRVHSGGFSSYYASGETGPEVRADGNGGRLPRGYYMQSDTAGLFGPFGCRTDADRAGWAYVRGCLTIPEVESVASVSRRTAGIPDLRWQECGAKSSRRYHVLIGRPLDGDSEIAGPFEILFGDYDKGVVEDERDEYADHPGNSAVWSNLRIITCGETQAEINAAVAEHNANNAPAIHDVQQARKIAAAWRDCGTARKIAAAWREAIACQAIKTRDCGAARVAMFYDTESDNYEIEVDGRFVWGSNGDNRPELADSIFEIVCDTAFAIEDMGPHRD